MIELISDTKMLGKYIRNIYKLLASSLTAWTLTTGVFEGFRFGQFMALLFIWGVYFSVLYLKDQIVSETMAFKINSEDMPLQCHIALEILRLSGYTPKDYKEAENG